MAPRGAPREGERGERLTENVKAEARSALIKFGNGRWLRIGIGGERRGSGQKDWEKTKSSELSFAALWLVPSPRYFANLN